jgi:cyclic dehypoxanthinyl futalosine synthase
MAIHVHAFSSPEVKFVARKERMSFYDVIARLKDAGLMSIPGGGAEVLSDGIRKEVLAYPKCSADEWSDVMRQAHRNATCLHTSATMMYGMGEPVADRVEHFQRVRDLQDETGGFTAFILLDLPARAYGHARHARDLLRGVPADARRVAAAHEVPPTYFLAKSEVVAHTPPRDEVPCERSEGS